MSNKSPIATIDEELSLAFSNINSYSYNEQIVMIGLVLDGKLPLSKLSLSTLKNVMMGLIVFCNTNKAENESTKTDYIYRTQGSIEVISSQKNLSEYIAANPFNEEEDIYVESYISNLSRIFNYGSTIYNFSLFNKKVAKIFFEKEFKEMNDSYQRYTNYGHGFERLIKLASIPGVNKIRLLMRVKNDVPAVNKMIENFPELKRFINLL